VPRRHQWVALIAYRLDDETAAKFFAGPEGPPVIFSGPPPVDPSRATLTNAMIDQELSNVGCIVCEQQWHEGRHRPCPGEPRGYTREGIPLR
jgi:hypothetical protein